MGKRKEQMTPLSSPLEIYPLKDTLIAVESLVESGLRSNVLLVAMQIGSCTHSLDCKVSISKFSDTQSIKFNKFSDSAAIIPLCSSRRIRERSFRSCSGQAAQVSSFSSSASSSLLYNDNYYHGCLRRCL